ncbi:MAG: hypothetical protein Q8N63_03670 [Nanoarchaeota archaeon]|nr:hypothetical protein [Nanoarchaeota archaeon]
MRATKTKSRDIKPIQQETTRAENNGLSTIISARTGLTPADDAVMRTLPKGYNGKTVGDALDYLLQQKGLQDDEIPLAQSIRKEMKADDFVVVVNGKNAELTEIVTVTRKEHKLPNNQVRPYNSLEIEVSAVQEGGHYRLY